MGSEAPLLLHIILHRLTHGVVGQHVVKRDMALPRVPPLPDAVPAAVPTIVLHPLLIDEAEIICHLHAACLVLLSADVLHINSSH